MVDPVFSKSLKWNIICSTKYNNEHYSFVTSSREWYLNFIYQMKIINFLSKFLRKIRLLLTTSKSEVVTPKQKEKKTEENRNLILFCFPLIGCGLRGLEFQNNFSRSYDIFFFSFDRVFSVRQSLYCVLNFCTHSPLRVTKVNVNSSNSNSVFEDQISGNKCAHYCKLWST